MPKNKEYKDKQDENAGNVVYSDEQKAAEAEAADKESCCGESEAEEIKELKEQLQNKTKQYEEIFGMLQRNAAEFDNYKKRTAKEKESIYNDTVAEVVAAFLPIADNLERAVSVGSQDEGQSLREGVTLVLRQLKETFKKLGVEEIEAKDSEFDPQLHNAVMHIEDDNFGNNVIVEEFQRGYKLKDKVIRHSMVKVAN